MPLEVVITCLGHHERILLEDAITDAISGEQRNIQRLSTGRDTIPKEAVHDVRWFIATGQDRIKSLTAIRDIISRTPVCKSEGR